jgi:PAS domain-containing protein
MLAIRSQDSIHPDDAKRVLKILAGRSGDDERIDHTVSYRLRRKDGTYAWVEATGRAVDIAGEQEQRLVIIRGIEHRVMAEQRLRDSEARYRLLADNSTDMVFQLDQDLVRRYVSPSCRELWAMSRRR